MRNTLARGPGLWHGECKLPPDSIPDGSDGVPVALLLPSSLLMPLGQQKMAQVVGSLPLIGETRMEFPAPGISLAQPQLLQTFGE